MIPEEVPVKPGPLGTDSQPDEIGRVIGEAGHRQPAAQASPVRRIAMISHEGTVPSGPAVAAARALGRECTSPGPTPHQYRAAWYHQRTRLVPNEIALVS